jgi:hypothetical protein
MAAYCNTTLQGDKCTDSRCPYRHDILGCEPCGCSLPAPLLKQHQKGKEHLRNVASSRHTKSGTPQQPPSAQSQPSSSGRLFTPPADTPPISGDNTSSPTNADPRATVSDEGGLDFVAEGTGAAENILFPTISHVISVEKTEASSSLSVRSITLTPSPSSWCECFDHFIQNFTHASHCSFVAALLGKTMLVLQNLPRKVLVTFKAPHAGTFHASLKITFSDKRRPNDQEFTVTRELRGRAILPIRSTGSGRPPNAGKDDKIVGEERAGITVSHDFDLEFSVERSSPDEPFAQQTKELVITKSTIKPLVSFKTARVCSSDDIVARCVHVWLGWVTSYFLGT